MSKASAFAKLGDVTSATRDRAEEVWDYLHARGYDLTRLWGIGTEGTEHPSGRAVDFMITGKGLGRVVGYLIAKYLWANRVRLGLKWLIWDGEIWSTTLDNGRERGKRPYHGESDHSDHVHAYFTTKPYVGPADAEFEVWHVDPDKVDNFLWAVKGGEVNNVKLAPGRIVKIVRWKTDSRRTWGITAADNWIAKAYLKRGKP